MIALKETPNVIHPVMVDVDALVQDKIDLVSLPEVFLKIRQLMDDLDAELEDFAKVVNTDPALAATVLKVVNSAYYGMAGQVTTISRALNLTGLGQLHDLVLMVSTVGKLKLTNDIETLTTFWRRSIFCGVLTKKLGERANVKDADTLFIIGLLHEIGRLLLFIKYPEQSKQAIVLASDNVEPLSDVEKSVFGTDFSNITQRLMVEWKLPEKVQDIAGNQLQPDKATNHIVETQLVNIAHKLAVNEYSGADNFEYEIDSSMLEKIGMSNEILREVCSQALEMSQEMEKLVLGN